MSPPGDPPDSGRGRAARGDFAGTESTRPGQRRGGADDADSRARAAAAVIERDVREGLAVEAITMSLPRTRTPAEESMRAAIDKVRQLSPEWHVAEQTARALDEIADAIEAERAERLATEAARQRAAERDADRKSWRAPVWRAIQAIGAAGALALLGVTVNALISHGDSRRAAAQQADVIAEHGKQIDAATASIETERRERFNADADLRAAQAADHAVLSLFAARLGVPTVNP